MRSPPSSQDVRIRPALEGDAAAVLTLIEELAAFEHLSHEMTATEAGLRRWLFAEDPAARALVADLKGEVVAYAVYFRTFSTFLGRPGLYLEDLYVREELRSQGIGRAMVAWLAHEAVRLGYGRVEWSALNWNRRAIDLYLRLGALPEEGWTAYRLTGTALSSLAAEHHPDASVGVTDT